MDKLIKKAEELANKLGITIEEVFERMHEWFDGGHAEAAVIAKNPNAAPAVAEVAEVAEEGDAEG